MSSVATLPPTAGAVMTVRSETVQPFPAPPHRLDVVRPTLPVPVAPPALRRGPSRITRVLSSAAWATLGLSVIGVAWAIAASRQPDLPTPAKTLHELTTLLSSPFHDSGPNDKGIGLQMLASLQRVGFGFGLAALLGVPLGLAMGASARVWKAANPIVNLLRPVSPLAWFPIWLVLLKDAPKAAIWVIFVTALWPIILNTAAGAASVPRDQRNVARVFKFSRRSYLRNVLLPHTLPSIVTGLRLSIGTAWMVIVAVEMLSGGSGIGFFVWDSYNASNLARVIAAIVLIGATGVVMDIGFLRLGRKVATPEVAG